MRDLFLASRRECKYRVPLALVPRLRAAIRPFVEPDPWAAALPDHAYPVETLYLDSPGLDLYSATVRGLRNRFKLRLRRYGTDPDAPVHAEVKRRSDDVVLKTRERVPAESVRRLLARDLPRGTHGAGFAEFRREAERIGAGPVVVMRYRREAWQSRTHEPVRITFDTALWAAHALGRGEAAEDTWREVPLGGSVLEIKFTGALPGWAADLVHDFELERQSVPKYLLAVDHVRPRGRARAAGASP